MKKAKKPMTEMAMITRAVSILRAGGLVAFPTETVYGLGADARQADAIQKIFQVKKRPATHPLIVHIGTIKELDDWALDIPPVVYQLAEAFWPGPLTFILKKQSHVLDSVTSQQETVGVRMPNHPVALALLQAYGSGLVAPSANLFTHISPTTAEAVYEELGQQVELILEGGECAVGLESTILDVTSEAPRILRPGMISAEAIAAVLGKPVAHPTQSESETRVPGMHQLHYAPQTPTSLIATSDLVALSVSCSSKIALLRYQTTPPPFTLSRPQSGRIEGPSNPAPFDTALRAYSGRTGESVTSGRTGESVTSGRTGESVTSGRTGESVTSGRAGFLEVFHLPETPEGYAHDLYRILRQLDHQHFQHIYIEQVPATPAWAAIQDRLLKATGGTISSFTSTLSKPV